MNTASLLLNVARPSASATSATPVAGSTASSGTPSSKGFDHAQNGALPLFVACAAFNVLFTLS